MFAFCSEIKGLLTLDQVQTKVNPDGLSQIFTFWSTISPITPFDVPQAIRLRSGEESEELEDCLKNAFAVHYFYGNWRFDNK